MLSIDGIQLIAVACPCFTVVSNLLLSISTKTVGYGNPVQNKLPRPSPPAKLVKIKVVAQALGSVLYYRSPSTQTFPHH
jgi:hypothetical protein